MEYEYWMASLHKIGSGKRRQACEVAGGAKRLYEFSEQKLKNLHFFTEEEIQYICESRNLFDIEGMWGEFQKKNVTFIPFFHNDYPDKLRDIYNPPYALYVKGRLPDEKKKSVAVVGARSCSEYGRSIARMLGKTLAQHHVQVISGMALGIDSASQAGALEGEGETFAVLGSGCDVCYPRSSQNIYQNILSGQGGVISELSPGTSPLPRFFPMRNRIISALSDIVVVVEARKKSGSLITADFALEQGRDVYAVPGRYMDSTSEGCNRLIEQGAGILYDVDNFLKNTGISDEKRQCREKCDRLPLEKEEILVYSCLDLNPKHIDSLIEESGMGFLTVLHNLDSLKKKNLIQETFQNYYCKKL